MDAGTVEQKDVVIAVLGAAVALAGLLLVLEGFVFAAIGGLQEGVPNRKVIKTSYRRASWATFVVLLVVLLCAAMSMIWLLTQQAFGFVVALFLLSLVLVLLLAGALTWKLAA